MRTVARRLWKALPAPVKTRLRGSRWFADAARLTYPDRKAQFEFEVAFYRQLLRDLGGSARLIFDVGANNGEKTEVYLALGAAVVAVEPTPELAAYLRERFGTNPKVTVLGCAASNAAGTAQLWRVNNSAAMNTISQKNAEILASGVNARTPDHSKPELGERVDVETRTLDSLIDQFGPPDYIKIDVEGHEREVIAGLSRPVPLLSFEANLPEFLPETLEIIERLAAAHPGARFQAREHQGFVLPAWVTSQEINVTVQGGRPYLEVFAWNPSAGRST